MPYATWHQNVAFTGESGVGKEHVARLIHEGGSRALEPFIAINCAMFSGDTALANSSLFGHKKGAFTGAVEDRQGAFVIPASDLTERLLDAVLLQLLQLEELVEVHIEGLLDPLLDLLLQL